MAVCDVSDGVAVKTVLVLYIVHPLIHRIHFLSQHSDGWGVGVWLCSLTLYFIAMSNFSLHFNRIWNIDTGECVRVLHGHAKPVT